jgi:ABC-2 type transport system ATP-binding protein
MIDTERLTKKFGDLTAVDNLTLHVDDGEIFGFLGVSDCRTCPTVTVPRIRDAKAPMPAA